MKIANIGPFELWLRDLKAGKLKEHQPKRKTYHSKWYAKIAEKEGRILK